jgi:3-isopropylmalate/(R)-2-methylmalate dehydratase small subunit
VIAEAQHRWLLDNPGVELTIDVQAQTITLPDGSNVAFTLEPFARHCLLNGVDQLGFLLQHSDAISNFEQQEKAA